MERAKIMCPNTYLLTNKDKSADIDRLKKEHTPDRLYILKKNLQRQTGLKITSSIDEIEKNDDNYVLAQELLQDSYLLNERKINLRVYVVVMCHDDMMDVYVYNNGFMYYTKTNFKPGIQDRDNHITTGYIDRDVYVHNPMTHDEFKRYLDLPEGEAYHPKANVRKLSQLENNIRQNGVKVSDVIFHRIDQLMRDIFVSFRENICRKVDQKSNTIPISDDYCVQIFGADVAINDTLQPQIIEINKGPDLNPKDKRDSRIKKGLVNSVMSKVGLAEKQDSSDLRLILQIKK
jgi:hypothetical protein